MKKITHSKVMKVCAKRLKNAIKQLDKVIQASSNACIKFKCQKSINYISFCDENEHSLGNNYFKCRKNRRRVKSCRTRHASRKNLTQTNKDIKASLNWIHKPMMYGEQCATSALPTDQIHSLFLMKWQRCVYMKAF